MSSRAAKARDGSSGTARRQSTKAVLARKSLSVSFAEPKEGRDQQPTGSSSAEEGSLSVGDSGGSSLESMETEQKRMEEKKDEASPAGLPLPPLEELPPSPAIAPPAATTNASLATPRSKKKAATASEEPPTPGSPIPSSALYPTLDTLTAAHILQLETGSDVLTISKPPTSQPPRRRGSRRPTLLSAMASPTPTKPQLTSLCASELIHTFQNPYEERLLDIFLLFGAHDPDSVDAADLPLERKDFSHHYLGDRWREAITLPVSNLPEELHTLLRLEEVQQQRRDTTSLVTNSSMVSEASWSMVDPLESNTPPVDESLEGQGIGSSGDPFALRSYPTLSSSGRTKDQERDHISFQRFLRLLGGLQTAVVQPYDPFPGASSSTTTSNVNQEGTSIAEQGLASADTSEEARSVDDGSSTHRKQGTLGDEERHKVEVLLEKLYQAARNRWSPPAKKQQLPSKVPASLASSTMAATESSCSAKVGVLSSPALAASSVGHGTAGGTASEGSHQGHSVVGRSRLFSMTSLNSSASSSEALEVTAADLLTRVNTIQAPPPRSVTMMSYVPSLDSLCKEQYSQVRSRYKDPPPAKKHVGAEEDVHGVRGGRGTTATLPRPPSTAQRKPFVISSLKTDLSTQEPLYPNPLPEQYYPRSRAPTYRAPYVAISPSPPKPPRTHFHRRREYGVDATDEDDLESVELETQDSQISMYKMVREFKEHPASYRHLYVVPPPPPSRTPERKRLL